MATLITADRIWCKSTQEILEDFFAEAEFGKLAVAPGHGVHVLAEVAEADVVGQLAGIIKSDPDICISPGGVLPGAIRDACLTVVRSADLVTEKGFALLAIKATVARVAPAL